MEAAMLHRAFATRFGNAPDVVAFSPGRVNLIGEHIDYNGGLVLPAAIGVGNGFAARGARAAVARVHSGLFDETVAIELAGLAARRPEGHWSDYVVGALREFTRLGYPPRGIDVVVGTNMPPGGGLSSSASFTVGLAWTFNEAWGCGLSRMEIVHLARSVENRFVGVDCGVMDPFAVTMGRVGHCMALDCATLACDWIGMSTGDHCFVVANSMVPRTLAASKYNERRAECGRALALLREDHPGLEALCALSPGEVERSEVLARDPVARRRALHAASENLRVGRAVEALCQQRLDRLGRLMMASHASLRDDYEVSCAELDLLVELAVGLPGVLGARMTGAGFGGCVVSLVESAAVGAMTRALSAEYTRRTGLEPQIHSVTPSDGVRCLD